jgi:hypothetical protein
MSQKVYFLDFSLELKKNILIQPVTSKQPHKIVQTEVFQNSYSTIYLLIQISLFFQEPPASSTEQNQKETTSKAARFVKNLCRVYIK